MASGGQQNSSRTFVWVSERSFRGWTCSVCEWNEATPTLLTDPDAKTAFDRLALGKFRDHSCDNFPMRLIPADPNSVTARLRKLVSKGFKPKDAVELVLQEIALEHGHDLRMLTQAEEDGEDFLRRVRAGII